jgi:hypothetical protein
MVLNAGVKMEASRLREANLKDHVLRCLKSILAEQAAGSNLEGGSPITVFSRLS